MKTKRFFSVFLLVSLVMSLWAVPFASADDTDGPVLPEDPDILAKAALLVDANTGEVVYAKNEHQELYPASLTKIMTALLTLEAVDAGKLTMDQPLTATATALSSLSSDGSSAGIKVGETMPVRDLLYCMLVVSANEACDVLAEAVSGSVNAFVSAMNDKAAELGCENTHFANPNGLHDPQHYTSAWDMYLITKAAMEYPDFMTICDTAAITIPATNMSGERNLYTTNHLLSNWRVIGYRNTEAHGIKTGSTDAAGYCLVSSAVRADRQLISVVLGAELMETEDGDTRVGSFIETSRLFDWGFDNFTTKTVLTEDEMIQEVPVALSKEAGYVVVHPAYTAEAVLPSDLEPEALQRTVTLTSDVVDAPVAAGQELGAITLSYDGVDYVTVPLLAVTDVSASRFLVVKHALKEFFSRTIVKILLVVLVVLAVLVFLFAKPLLRRRRYGSARSKRRHIRSYRGRRFR